MTLPVNDAVPGAVRQLRHSLRVSGLARAVAAYFSPEEDFAGLSFTCLGSNPRDAVTASDLLAVSLLDIAWRPEAVRQLLGTSAAMVSGLLSAIRSDIDLWEASADLLAISAECFRPRGSVTGCCKPRAAAGLRIACDVPGPADLLEMRA